MLIYLLRKVRSHEEGSQFFGICPVAAPGLKLGAAREVPYFLLSQNFLNKILRGFSYLAS